MTHRISTRLLACGLMIATTACQAQAPATEAFVPDQVLRIVDMAGPRAAHQATRLPSGRILVTGGCAGECDVTLDDVEVFDRTTKRFESLPGMAVARSSHAAVALDDGRVLVLGGWNDREVTASAEAFDEATGRFGAMPDMTQARGAPRAVTLDDGRVLVTGGQTDDLASLDSAELFDPVTDRFTPTDAMASPRVAHTAVLLEDGRVLIAGGASARRGNALRSAELFDPATGRFEPTGDMGVPRQKHAAVRLDDGRVLIVGGADAGPRSERYRSTELYDPATGRFSPGPDMASQRYKLPDGVVRLPSGDVLVAAGASQVECFDPGTGRFATLSGEMAGPNEFATATVLDDGDVVVLGGYGEGIETSAAAWLVHGVTGCP